MIWLATTSAVCQGVLERAGGGIEETEDDDEQVRFDDDILDDIIEVMDADECETSE